MITRARILEFRDLGHKICDVFGMIPRAEWDDLIYCAMRGQYLDSEIAARSAAIAADPTARAKHDPEPSPRT